MDNSYDIFRKHPDGMWVWVESVKDLQIARQRLEKLAALCPAEYLAASRNTGQVAAKESSRNVYGRDCW